MAADKLDAQATQALAGKPPPTQSRLAAGRHHPCPCRYRFAALHCAAPCCTAQYSTGLDWIGLEWNYWAVVDCSTLDHAGPYWTRSSSALGCCPLPLTVTGLDFYGRATVPEVNPSKLSDMYCTVVITTRANTHRTHTHLAIHQQRRRQNIPRMLPASALRICLSA